MLGFGGRRAPVRLIRSVHPGGLIYFAPNLATNAQIRQLSRQSQVVARRTGQPLLIMTDQEGGLVTRLPGTSGSREAPSSTATPSGPGTPPSGPRTTSLDVGINVDLAPVADVNTVGSRGVIGSRSFSSRPSVAARMVRAQVCGYHRGGVATTVKHFPGHGSTTTDSHLHPARIRETRSQWRRDRPAAVRPCGGESGRPGDARPPGLPCHGSVGSPGDDLGSSGPSAAAAAGRVRAAVVVTDALNMRRHHVVRQHRLDRGPGHPRRRRPVADAATADGRDSLGRRRGPPGHDQRGRINASVRRILELKQRLGLFRSAKHLPQCR